MINYASKLVYVYVIRALSTCVTTACHRKLLTTEERGDWGQKREYMEMNMAMSSQSYIKAS